MKFRTRTSIAALAVVSVVGGGVAGAVLTGPAAAIAQETEDDGAVVTEGVQTLADVLAELVDEGVITQEQADIIGERLRDARPERGFRSGMGHGFLGGAFDEVADALGMTAEDLGTALREGSSIADIAADTGIDVQSVIDLLVAEAQERLDEAVADGRLTADEAAEKAAELETRIIEFVNGEVEFGGRRGHGPRGFSGPAESDTDTAEEAIFNA